jgi:hypothetical protein
MKRYLLDAGVFVATFLFLDVAGSSPVHSLRSKRGKLPPVTGRNGRCAKNAEIRWPLPQAFLLSATWPEGLTNPKGAW